MQRFSHKARQALAAAQQTASQMQHPRIEISHLLLALVELEESAAHKLLAAMRLRPEAIRAHLATLPGDPVSAPELDPSIKRVLQFAVDASRRWRHSYVGTEHLLLALARHNAPITRDLLATAHTDGDRIRQRIESMFEAGILPEQPAQSPKTATVSIADEWVRDIVGRIVHTLQPDDWKTLGRISRQMSTLLHDTGRYNLILRGTGDEVKQRVLAELLRRAIIEPDTDNPGL